MSRGIKVLWIVIGCLFAVGVVLAAVGFALGGSGSVWFDRNGMHFGSYEVQTYETANLESEAFDSVDISLLSGDVELVSSGSGGSYGYEFTYTGSYEPTVEVSNGTLRVVEQEDNWHMNILGLGMWDAISQQAKLTIYVPSEATLSTVNLSVASGDTFLGGSDIGIKTLACRSASGSVNIDAMSFEELNLDVASGDVRLDTITAQSAVINIVSGTLMYNEGSIENLVLDVASGDIRFKGGITKSLVLRMVSGDAHFELDGSEDDYSFSVKRISGDIRINGREALDSSLPTSTDFGNSAAAGHIEIDTTSGSVNLSFSN